MCGNVFVFSIAHDAKGSCDIANPKGISGKLKDRKDKLSITYTYSVTFKVSYILYTLIKMFLWTTISIANIYNITVHLVICNAVC